MKKDNNNDDGPERSALTSTQCSMIRFEQYITDSGQAALSEEPQMIGTRNECLNQAMFEVFKWPIITKENRAETRELKKKAYQSQGIFYNRLKFSKRDNFPNIEWSRCKYDSDRWQTCLQRLGMKVWGEKESKVNQWKIKYG